MEMSQPPKQGPRRVVRPGTICKARVFGSLSGRAVIVEVTAIIAADENRYEVWGYRLDRLRHRFGHMQHQRPHRYEVPVGWL